jgi:uncharacterized cupredoxin-like copper-binding protein
MFKLSVTAVLALLLAVPFGGCGGDDGGNGGGGQTSAAAAETIDVSLTDFEITPANPRVERGGQVEFRVRNDGETVHDLEVEGPGGETKLASELDPGQSGTLKVDLSEPGRYEWYCPVGNHREQGMEGEVTVAGEGGGTGTQTNTTEDPGSPY